MEVVKEQLDALLESGLYERSTKIFLSVLTRKYSPNIMIDQLYHVPLEFIELLKRYPKNKMIIRLIGDCSLYEREILNMMRKDSIEWDREGKKVKIWYIHSKGISDRHQHRPIILNNIKDWRKIMEEIVIWNYKACIKLLDKYDVCGMNYEIHNEIKLDIGGKCFSGNFWWSHNKYIVTLSDIPYPSGYLYPEMWICSRNPNIFSFFNTNIDHYHEGFPLEENKNHIYQINDEYTIEENLVKYNHKNLGPVIEIIREK